MRHVFRATIVPMAKPRYETGIYVRFRHKPPLDRLIAQLAEQQHAVFALWQLLELGMIPSSVHKRCERGRLHRMHRTVYSLIPPRLLSREGRWMAAVLAAGPGAALSHDSAGALHELVRTEAARSQVTVPSTRRRHHPGIRIHTSQTLTDADVTRVNKIPCTTVARTLLDLADVLDRRRLERAFDQAEVMQALNLRAIQDQLQRNATRSAAGRVRGLLEAHYIGSTPTESELEEAFLALCRRAGLPQPELQQWLQLGDGEPPIRVDFLWRAQRVVVETDGESYHGTHQAALRDARRDQRLIAHGFKPIRTSWRQIFYAPAELVATLKALLLF